jgi:hypothetical protein
MNILKSIGAVLAGMIFIVVTHTVTDRMLEGLGIFPPPEQGLHDTSLLLLATVYRTVFSVAGSYLTARLAPSRPMLHAMIIGVIGVIGSAAGAVVATQMNLGPLWYPILLLVLSPPIAWLGGRLATRKSTA